MKIFLCSLTGFMSLLICMSCSKLLPSSKITVASPWNDYESAKLDYMKIIPGETTILELKKLGFDPEKVPNIRIMRSSEIIGIFIPNSSIEIKNLSIGIQECIERKANCIGYMIEPSIMNRIRSGNFWADMFTFKRTTTTSGWEFRGLVIIVNGIVTYRDPAGGRPFISSEEVQKKPLGPIQEIGGILEDSARNSLD